MTRLTERQEKILCSYYDGEANWIGKFLACRLLASNPEAKKYLEELALINQKFTAVSCASKKAQSSCKLWSKIKGELDYEGKKQNLRKLAEKYEHSSEWHRQFLIPAVMGTAMAGLLLVVLWSPKEQMQLAANGITNSTISENENLQKSGDNIVMSSEEISPSSQNSDLGLVRYAERSSQSQATPFEVQWLRSEGKVHLINTPQGEPAIIWIRKRNAAPGDQQRVPSGDLIRVLPDRLPEAFTVADRK